MTDKEMCAIFAKNLTDIMSDKGIKQADIVRELHVAKATVSGWCSGTNIPRTDALGNLTQMLDVSLSDLLIKKEPTPASGDGQTAPLDLRLMNLVSQLSPDGKKMLIAQLEVLLKSQSLSPDSQD